MATTNNNDQRLTQVETDRQEALKESEKLYGGMISSSDSYFDAQIGAAREWADTQSELQQERTDFTIEQIEQQKEQTKKDYTREQAGAYADWKKQSDKYGVNSEQMAASGLEGSGYSESSKVSIYNTYQNRVSTAKEALGRAILNYDNAITEARLQNSAVLAEIAYQALQAELELSLTGFEYKNELLMAQAEAKFKINEKYDQDYKDILSQINSENALTEQMRQYREYMDILNELEQDEDGFETSELLKEEDNRSEVEKAYEDLGSLLSTMDTAHKKAQENEAKANALAMKYTELAHPYTGNLPSSEALASLPPEFIESAKKALPSAEAAKQQILLNKLKSALEQKTGKNTSSSKMSDIGKRYM